MRRACRLFPALGVFLVAVALLRSMGLINDVPGKEFLEAVFYVRNIFGRSQSLGHLWSLSLEEQFYLLWPLLFLLFGVRRMSRIALSLAVLVAVWRGAAISFHLWKYDTGVFYLRPWFRFDAIAIGCWLALTRLPKSPRYLFALSAAGLMSWSLIGERLTHPLFITVQTILAAVFFFSVVKGGSIVRGLMSLGLLRWLGAISYSLYIWQQIFVVSRPSFVRAVPFPMDIVAAFALAILSRHFIEKPFLKLGRSHLAKSELLRLGPKAAAIQPLPGEDGGGYGSK